MTDKSKKYSTIDSRFMKKDVHLRKLKNITMNAEIKFKHEVPVQIRFSDVDQYGHMNNSVYFSLYDFAKTSYFRDVFGQDECKNSMW